jgi:hypothetical protein
MGLKIYDADGVLQEFDPVDDADVLKKDGSVALTGDLDAGDNKLSNVKEPAAAGDAIRVPDSVAAGDVFYWNGTTLVRLAKGTAGQVLTMNTGATAPEWAT